MEQLPCAGTLLDNVNGFILHERITRFASFLELVNFADDEPSAMQGPTQVVSISGAHGDGAPFAPERRLAMPASL